jgi:dTDP-4-amino-4,6-dideoxygalactose transaminase
MAANMEFNNLRRQLKKCEKSIRKNIDRVFDHGKFINGPEICQLEEKLAEYVGVDFAIGCASGTDALTLALMAHDIGRGDAVFTSAFSFVAAAETIALLGATPIFVDIDPFTFNMDPACLETEIREVSENMILRPRAIIAVNLFGLPCDYNKIMELGIRYGLTIIEDAAQSFGAEYFGKKSGGLSDIGCTSFFPSKPLGCYGDGGMIFTNSQKLAGKISSFSQHGRSQESKYFSDAIGINSRLDSIQAAILLAKFQIFENELSARKEIATFYAEKLNALHYIQMQYIPRLSESAHAQFPVVFDDKYQRNCAIQNFIRNQIPYQIYYPAILPEMPPYRNFEIYGQMKPGAVNISNRILCLPFGPYITETEIDRVYKCLKG